MALIIDPRKLEKTAMSARSGRKHGVANPGGPFAIVRENLATIEGLLARGASYAGIAAGLVEQGLTRPTRQVNGGEPVAPPIDGKYLSTVVCQLRRQAARRAEKAAKKQTDRSSRLDTVSLREQPVNQQQSPQRVERIRPTAQEKTPTEIRREVAEETARIQAEQAAKISGLLNTKLGDR